MKTRHIFLSLLPALFLLAGAVMPVLAAYLGPDRTRTVTNSVCHVALRQCKNISGTYKYVLIQETACGEDKWWLAYPNAERACNAANVGYEYYEKGDVTVTETVTYPAATVTDELLNCTLKNGWCGVTQPSLAISGNEPVAGYVISRIEGQRNGTNFTRSGSSAAFTLGEGQTDFTYWAVSTFGDTSLMGTKSVRVDVTPPQASLTVNGTLGSAGWYVSSVQVTPTASDALSGLDTVFVAPSGTSDWQPFLNLLDGVHIVRLSALDLAGNRFLENFTVLVDTQPPSLQTALSGVSGTGGWFTSPVTLSAITSDATSGVASSRISLDDGTTWASLPYTLEGDGQYMAVFRVLDAAGNQTQTSLAVRLDAAPPQASLSLNGEKGAGDWYISPVDVSVNGSDMLSGLASLALSVDGAPSANSIVLGDGMHNLNLTAQDNAGNISTQTSEVKVDTAPPALAATLDGSAGQGGWYVSPVVLSVQAADETSGLAVAQVSLDDGSTWLPLPATLDNGTHTALCRASDLAGNTATASVTVSVDQIKPELSFPMDGALVSGRVSLLGLASDSLSGLASVRVSLDGGSTWFDAALDASWWRYDWDASALPNGNYAILVEARDTAGNTATERYSVTLDNQAPGLSVTGWTAPGQGEVAVEARGSKIASVRVVVRDPAQGMEQEIYNGTGSGVLTWGGAVPGSYPLVATACDAHGRCAEASGVVVVPMPEVQTVIVTEEPSRMVPPAAALPEPAVVVEEPSPVAPQIVELPAAQEQPPALNLLPVLLALLILPVSRFLLDPRPRILRRLTAIVRGGMEKKP